MRQRASVTSPIRWGLAALELAALACTMPHAAHGQDNGSTEVVPGMEDACIENLGYLNCEHGMPKPPGAAQLIVVHYAAIAISPSTMIVGGSHGQNSLDDAEQTALQNCRRRHAQDCKAVTWAENACVSLAEDVANKAYGFYAGPTRDQSAAGALAQCRSGHGQNCVTVTAPCAADDIRWSSPLPLPPGPAAASIDPNMVGTWELFINPGRWIWRVAPNGTYELHSEAMDNTPSNAGTFTATNGHYTLHALTMAWDDAGTYKVQSPGVVVATGKLGTGTWRRIGGASANTTRSPPLARPSGPPITIRK